MTSSVRFIDNLNKTNPSVPLTVANFPRAGDGDDKKIRIIQRTYTDGDIGPGSGQTSDSTQTTISNTPGCLIGWLLPNENLVCIDAKTYRPSVLNSCFLLDNMGTPGEDNDHYFHKINYFVYDDGSIRVIDNLGSSPVGIILGDFTVVTLVTGIGNNWLL